MNSATHNLLTKGVSNVIDRDNLQKRLEAGEKLVVKFGIDPSGTIVHIGHMVPILKLKQFQELGHKVVFLIGDATAQVGDASDKDAERPMLAREETRKNAEVFLQKFAKVLDLSKIEVYWNSEGLDTVNFAWVGELAKNFSVAEMLDRDNFSKRYKGGMRISLQEFLYPIMQGYDSVAIAKKYGSCDVELGGNDQYFNLLAGRRLMEAHGLPKQDIMTFDLLIGSDGKKMSKTSPNTIAIDEAPQSMYQKLINVRDDLIVTYYELATDATLEEVETVKNRLESWEHPNTLKIELAQRIITMYHGKPYDASDVSNIEGIRIQDIKIPSYIERLINDWLIKKQNSLKDYKLNDNLNSNEFHELLEGLWWFRIETNNNFTVSFIEAAKYMFLAIWELSEKDINKKGISGAMLERLNDLGIKPIYSDINSTIKKWDFLEMISCVSYPGDVYDENTSTKDNKVTISISDLLKQLGFCATSGDVRNALAGNSIRVDGVVVTDPKFLVTISDQWTLIEMGKKKAKRVFL